LSQGQRFDLPLGAGYFTKGNILMLSNICAKCGKALCICLPLALGGAPVIEAIPEEHCSATASCTERPLATEPWSPDAPEHDYSTTGQPAIELAETGATRLVIEFPLGIDTVAAALATTA
jgi:hypothetical protein